MNAQTTIPHKTGAAYLLPEGGADEISIRRVIFDADLRGSYAWGHPLRDAIPAAIAIYGDMRRRYGNVPVGVHAVWTTNKTYNDLVKRDGHEKALLAAFIQLMHDRIEDGREYAKKLGLVFDEAKTLDAICYLWVAINPKATQADFDRIRADLIWMTDDPYLKKERRIQAQIDKCFKKDKCDLDIIRQTLRFNDKLHHITSDVAQRKAFLRHRHEGKSLPSDPTEQRKYGVPDDMVQKCFDQAMMKRYVLRFPDIPMEDKIKYIEGLLYLRGQVLELDLKNTFKNAANMVSGRHSTPTTPTTSPTGKPQPVSTFAI